MNVPMQKEILSKYLGLYKKPSIRVLGSESGIQMTRFFRLLNGSVMRVDEYQKIQSAIVKKTGVTLHDLFCECERKLSESALRELEELLQKKLKLWEMKQVMRRQDQMKLA